MPVRRTNCLVLASHRNERVVSMQKSWSPMRAAIDIGSNTIHIVVARATAHMLDIAADEVELVRIGESVTATGRISQEKIDHAISILKQYKALAEQHSAEDIFVVATEAIRQASNSTEFIEQVRQKTGLQIQIISGTAEATLTFYGATYEIEAQPNPPDLVGVMDLGGGSLELVTAKHSHINWKTSVPIGSGWLHDRYLAGDPPEQQKIVVAETFLQTYFQGMHIKRKPSVLIVTGGSANSLLYLTHRAFKLEMHQTQLTQHDLLRCEGLLGALPAEEIAQRFGQPVGRARIMLAGAMIISAMMSRLQLNAIHISPHGIREGILLAYERYGASWMERVGGNSAHPSLSTLPAHTNHHTQASLADLSHAEHMLNGSDSMGKGIVQEETFVQAGQHVLRERLKKFLEWPDEVLKHEDVEAVHKMRVASRRLRAALDAYEFCCEPKAFKRVYHTIKEAADTLGAARDTDVMLQELRDRLEHMAADAQPGVQWLIDRLQTFRQEKQDELEDFLLALDQDRLEQEVKACISKGQVQSGKG